ncbi:NADH-quinone oxidoreductase subunit H [bacterium]|nr:NADH-quinone oxidoreductase subunit H [bacterium]
MIFIFNILFLIIAPFLIVGIINKTKAFFAGRKGASILQPFFDFIKLIKKGLVISTTTSWVFKFTPVITVASVLFASLFAPLAGGFAIIEIPCAFIIFAYSLNLGKFFSLLSALDTGSSFEGMGASREACFSTIVEPAFFIALASITALTGNFSFNSLNLIFTNAGIYGYLIIILLSFTLLLMLLTECSRVPVDDPTTHLELTMIHEVMVLDNSGPDLAMISWASAIKIFLYESLIVNLFIPNTLGIKETLLMYTALLLCLSIVVGLIESSMARFRMSHVFEFIFIMTIMALLILALATYKIYGG